MSVTTPPPNNVVPLFDAKQPTKTIVAAGQIWEILPENARGPRGLTLNVEFLGGQPSFHSTNVWHRGSAPEGTENEAVLWKDPVRERLGPATRSENDTYTMPDRVLVLAPPIGEKGEPEVLPYTDKRAKLFLKREIEQRYNQNITAEQRVSPLAPKPELLMGKIVASNEMFAIQIDKHNNPLNKAHIIELDTSFDINKHDLYMSSAVTRRNSNNQYEIEVRGLGKNERPLQHVSLDEAKKLNKTVVGIIYPDNDKMYVTDVRNRIAYELPNDENDQTGALRARTALVQYGNDTRSDKNGTTSDNSIKVYPIQNKYMDTVNTKVQDGSLRENNKELHNSKTIGAVLLPEADLWQARAILEEVQKSGNQLHAFNIVAVGKHGTHIVAGIDEHEVAKRLEVEPKNVKWVKELDAQTLYEVADGDIDKFINELKIEEKQEHNYNKEPLSQKTSREPQRDNVIQLDVTGRQQDDRSNGRMIKRPRQ